MQTWGPWGAIALAALLLHTPTAAALDEPHRYVESLKLANETRMVGADGFGDVIGHHKGSVEFIHTDIDIPGNSALPVRLVRRLAIEDKMHSQDLKVGDFGMAGELDVPYMYGVHSGNGWQVASTSTADRNKRCSIVAPPPMYGSSASVSRWWSGNFMHIPGQGDQEILAERDGVDLPMPSSGTYPWVTKAGWRIGCLPATANGHPGEGFVALGPDGTKYTFNHVITKSAGTFREIVGNGGYGDTPYAQVPRLKVFFAATQVQDRFGNTVTYSYSGDQITGISSSDDRFITISQRASGKITQVTSSRGTWNYSYGATSVTVTRPDASTWVMSWSGALALETADELVAYNPNFPCVGAPPLASGEIVYSVKHPAGATATYQFSGKRHYRSNVVRQCSQFLDHGNWVQFLRQPNFSDSLTLVSRTISGAALAPVTTTFTYDQAGGMAFRDICDDPPTPLACPSTASTTVRRSDGKVTQFTHGIMYDVNEGQLLSVKEGYTDSGGVDHFLRSVDSTYATNAEADAATYPSLMGRDLHAMHSDVGSSGLRPLKKTVIKHLDTGDTFTREHQTFDSQARVLQTRRYSSLGISKAEKATYHDNLSKWVIGQIASRTCTAASPTSGMCNGNDVIEATEYDAATALPLVERAFGKLLRTYTYHSNGLLASSSDGRDVPTGANPYDTTIRLSNWKRGIPQTITFPVTTQHPATTKTAVVDNAGWIDAVTDENGFKTCYAQDAMGRTNKITYPSEGVNTAGACDETTWAPTLITFSDGHPAAKGLPASTHWRRVEKTGNKTTVTLYDLLWRPVVEQSYDAADKSGTITEVAKWYDADDRLVFESYPVASVGNYDSPTLNGKDYLYDSVGRLVETGQDWGEYSGSSVQNNQIVTSMAYLSGLRTVTTSPKSIVTTTAHRAYDDPAAAWPYEIQHPDAIAKTTLDRAPTGELISITRSKGTSSTSRSYLYNVYHELCAQTEPETGRTLMGYNGAGALAWSAAGLPSTAACELDGTTPAVASRRVDRVYDQRGRLTELLFADGRGDQSWSYTLDGLPSRVHTVNVVGANNIDNTWAYNRRRLATTEVQMLPAWYSNQLGYSYDAIGNLERIHYPSSDFVDFDPNALGQPRNLTGADNAKYVTGASYHPGGTLASFKYGGPTDSRVYNMSPYVQGLPREAGTAGVQRYRYQYDRHGNPTNIHDLTVHTDYNRLLRYDAMDRLTGAGSVSFGGNQWHDFTYDYRDNMETWVHGGIKSWRYCYNGNNQLEWIRSNATSCSGAGAGAGATYMTYDPQGNVLTKDETGYTFDLGNRLREVDGIERHRYDAHGRRILSMALDSGVVTWMYGGSGRLLYSRDDRTGKETDYIYLGGMLIAQREKAYGASTSTVKFQHADALGSPVAMTTTATSTPERFRYEPYGKRMGGAQQNGPGYTGHVFDTETGLNYMQQRYYDPESAAFISPDPVSAMSSPVANFGRYRYANNSPYTFVDPDGANGEKPKPEDRSMTDRPGVMESMVRTIGGGSDSRGKGETAATSGSSSMPGGSLVPGLAIATVLDSDSERAAFLRYWMGGGNLLLRDDQFAAIASAARGAPLDDGGVINFARGGEQYFAHNLNFYSSSEFNGMIGSGWVIYSSSGSAVGFYDRYDMNPKPWGDRDAVPEIQTRIMHWLEPISGAKAYDITYGIYTELP